MSITDVMGVRHRVSQGKVTTAVACKFGNVPNTIFSVYLITEVFFE